MVLASLFAGLTAICAWISVPVFDIAFTLQTFALFLTLGVLGGKWGSASIGIYLMLGAVGLPVFSGFQGGLGVLLGVTGGYLWGFLGAGLVYWALERVCKPLGMVAGLGVCYLCGTAWVLVYGGGGMGIALIIAKCVVPYLIPDGLKLGLALVIREKLVKYVK